MVNLDLKIGAVSHDNNAIIGGLGKDIGDVVANSAGAIGNIFSPTVGNIVQNTAKLLRNPWDTLTTGSSWVRFAKTFPAATADIFAKVFSLPFRSVEAALTYGVANNFERVVGSAKGVTTDAVRNWFHNGGQANAFMKGMGHLFGGAGDLVGSAAKLVPAVAEWVAKQPNKYIWNPLIATTQGWVDAQRLPGADYFQPKVLGNDDYHPVAANDNHAPHANDNHAPNADHGHAAAHH